MDNFYSQQTYQKKNKRSLSLYFLMAFGSFAFAQVAIAQTSLTGTVYRDFNGSGAKENTSAYNEPGVSGVTVKAYSAAGTLLATTTTDANGAYSFSAPTVANNVKVRLEFTGWQSSDYPAPTGLNSKSSVQFATANTTTPAVADFGINYPGHYIDNLNARVVVPTYVNGDNQTITGNWYDASDGDGAYAFNYDGTAQTTIAKQGQTGATWGTAYSRQADKLYYAAFVKRHVALGPLGVNGLYVTNGAKTAANTSSTTTFVNLNAINPAFDAGSLPGRSFSPGNNNKTQANYDNFTGGNVLTEVGKVGLGGITISDDGKYLYVINLADRRLWRIQLGANGAAPTLASQIVRYDISYGIAEGNSTFRPFAVKFHRGNIYVGGVLDGVKPDNSAVDRNELKAIVVKVDASANPATATFTQVLNAPLTYNRRANANTGFGFNKNTNYTDPNGTIPAATTCQTSWHPWVRNFNELTKNGTNIIHPQPMLSAIEFDPSDNDAMIIGISDRTGHQTGNVNFGMSGSTLYTGNSVGDIMKAGNTGGTYANFTIENNGTAGSRTTNGAGNNEGIGGGEFYYTDRFSANAIGNPGPLYIGNPSTGAANLDHDETSVGSVANFPGKEVISTAFDPAVIWYTGGVRYYANDNGVAKNGKVLYTGNDVSVFGKASGLGDIEIISSPAPIEIGNRVWFDANGNGIQDADENGIAGVTVQLRQGATVIATATTDASGNYYFSSDASRSSTGSAIYNISQLQPDGTYTIRIPNAQGGSVQSPLSTYELTFAHNGGADANAGERDSDGAYTGNDADITVATGVAGSNNHSYDFGFATIGTVSGGGGGGVESKSLGDAIATRVYKNAVNSIQGAVDYSKLPSATRSSTIRSNNAGTGLKLSDILPTSLSNSAYKSLITTPKDLLAITNAKDILSIDFVKNNIANAVAFGTQTSSEVYDHTKPICDRLKGAELIGLQTTSVKGIDMVQYTLKNNKGETEYAMSFIIGAKSGRSNYTIQSNWLNKDYTIDESMFNIQLWAGSPALVLEMATDIITRLQNTQPIQEIKSNAGLPKAYITAGARVEDKVELTINNTLSATSGSFEISDRANEQTTGTVSRTIPVTLTANGITKVSIPSSDLYESTINLYVNGQLTDVVFMADGAWGLDYNTSTTSIKSFTVTNSNKAVVKDEFPVFRNASVTGTTPDYLTVYKLLRAGGVPQDLSAFKTLKFTASGNATLTITLVKQSITNWKDQYSLQLPVSNDPQEYMISLSDFKSATATTPLNPNDINSIVVSMGPSSQGRSTEVTTSISNVSFTKDDLVYLRSLQAKDVTSYPNPSNGRFTVTFKADKDYSLNLKVTEAASGKVVATKAVNAVKGENNVQMNVDGNGTQKLYIINLEGSNIKYKASKVVIGKN
ncbi:MAG: SdrD B-like domain-containing protein [Sediminibacterium sp.]|jgi:hypothetical protein|nr:hypothetical protein [Chitinophagaceae bacterium]